MADKNIQLMSENGVDNLFPVTKWAIDGSNIIANGKSATFGTGTTYTATQDCWISMYFSNGINGVKIDGGETIFFGSNQTWGTYWFPLKKGQTVTIGNTSQLGPNGTNDCVRVYGIK